MRGAAQEEQQEQWRWLVRPFLGCSWRGAFLQEAPAGQARCLPAGPRNEQGGDQSSYPSLHPPCRAVWAGGGEWGGCEAVWQDWRVCVLPSAAIRSAHRLSFTGNISFPIPKKDTETCRNTLHTLDALSHLSAQFPVLSLPISFPFSVISDRLL